MKELKKVISNLSKETEILESLDWDEEKLVNLYEYLDIHFTGDSIIKPDILLQEIRMLYGEPCAMILREMFIEVSLAHGLFIYDPDVEN